MMRFLTAFAFILLLFAVAATTWAEEATQMVKVPVLTRALAAGDSFAGATEMREVEKTKVFAGTVRDQSELDGAIAGREMAAGKPVLRIHVKQDFPVSRNGAVSFRLKRGSIKLSGTGTALEDGELGSTVKVLNTATRSTMVAVVVGEGEVEVR